MSVQPDPLSENVEYLRERLAEAEQAAANKAGLLASVSHEIRTELSGILGMAQVVLESRLTPEQREYLEVVVHGSETLLTLVNDLLDASKIEAGRLELEPVACRMRDVLRSTLAPLRNLADGKGLHLIAHVDQSVPEVIVADPGRLRQIITNLVGNAIKFTDHGDVSIHVATEHVTTDDVRLRFEIADTGIGVPADRVSTIFEAYTQVDPDPERARRGTGLGLSIVKQLVTLMDGTIKVESVEGKGSIFTFTITAPVDAEASTDRPLEREASSELRDLPVLVCAANPVNADAIETALVAAGMKPETAADPETALDMLHWAHREDRPFAITVCDLGNGSFTLAERIRKDPIFHPMHLVVMPAIGQRGDAARCRRLDVAGYLTRPIPAEDIVQAMAVILTGPAPVDLGALVTRHWLRERRRRLNILVVDDSPTNRIVATRLLETRGHAVTPVAGGRAAIQRSKEHRFDLILMDLEMPDLDGFQATAAIRAAEAPAERTPIVGLGGRTDSSLWERSEEAGMDALVGKPFDIHQLATTIERLVAASER